MVSASAYANEAPEDRTIRSERQGASFEHTALAVERADAPRIHAARHPAEQLWTEHTQLVNYPPGVLPVPQAIRGTAFFPGGYGLFNQTADGSLPRFPHAGVMVLGHDFHSEVEYRRSLECGRESFSQPTWRNILKLLAQARIPPGDCFFTNFFMGLRQGALTTGAFPGAKSEGFVEQCRRFLQRQLQVQRPHLVLTLGIHAPCLIAPLSPDLAPWREQQGLKHLDAVGPVQGTVSFAGLPGFRTTVVALAHPCFRHATVRHRRFEGTGGAEAELKMLAAAKSMIASRTS